MSRDLDNEIQKLRRDLQVGLEKSRPIEQFGAAMILAMIGLDGLAEHAKKSQDPDERRRLFHEFERKKEPLKKESDYLASKKNTQNHSNQSEKCPDCGEEIFRSGGCPFCPHCGWSRCG